MAAKALPRASYIQIPDSVRRQLWSYINEHADQVVFTAWGFMKVRLGQLRPVFEALLGPDPTL